ncbi:MAG: antibiotic transporter permease [Anaerolineaceae bacterium]|nr:MAG: antibiotic transporter permease [Anaerolineaceae bacterium]
MRKYKKYISLIKTSMQQTLTYRSNFFMSIMVTILLFISSFFLWKSVFAGKDTISIYSWNHMKGYLLVAFICNTLLSWYSESSISRKILDGSVAMDLIKPYNFYYARLSETIGSSIFEGLVIGIASVVLIIILRIPLPNNIMIWVCFLISILFALLIKFAIVYLFSMLIFITSSYMGIQWARAAITNLLSGGLVPLVLFPSWCRTIFGYMPFQYIVSFPASIFLNQKDLPQIGNHFLIEVLWIITLFLLGKVLFAISIRKVTINGG